MLTNLSGYITAIKNSLGFSGPSELIAQWISEAVRYYSGAAGHRRIQGTITGIAGDRFLTLPDHWITTEFNKRLISNINTNNSPNAISQHYSPYSTVPRIAGFNTRYQYNPGFYNRNASQVSGYNMARRIQPPPLRIAPLDISVITVGNLLVTRLNLASPLASDCSIDILYDALHIIDSTSSSIPDSDSHYIISIARLYFRIYLLDKETVKQATIDLVSEIEKIINPLRSLTVDNGDNVVWHY